MQVQLTNVVENVILARMQARESFTALDISNTLKADRYAVRHRDVAEAVRDIYDSGAMDSFDYRRQLIPVVTEDGAKKTEAYVYYHESSRSSDYTERSQDALAPVPPDQARDLSDCVAACGLARSPHAVRNVSPGCRQDGALSIPRRLVEQLGWTEGDTLALEADQGRVTLGAASPDAAQTQRVWSGQRVRICKTKLRLGALIAQSIRLEISGDMLHLVQDEES